ncbi:MAG TPA: GNAT family N-acetyltransferase [Chloroflexia bacterium]|nr:GNAT family N-acetyltransferase [Chloroflexia bacterium]
MRSRFPWATSPSTDNPQVEPLGADQARLLRLPWLSRFSTSTLAAHLARHPDHSFWVPATGEYALGSPWRYRDDIAQIVEVHARRGKVQLVGSLARKMGDRGYKLVLLDDDTWRSDPRAFAALGFSHLERIVFFHKELRANDPVLMDMDVPNVEMEQASVADLDLLMRLDHSSFPWLWWNSRIEFKSYIQQPDVTVKVALSDDRPVGYASYTMYKGWAHLDRLAVITEQQGKGFGAAELRHVLCEMRDLGALSVNLSTQEHNTRSHSLYTRFGFRQTSERTSFYAVDPGKLT